MMGKLNKLRRKIKKDPTKWIEIVQGTKYYVRGARILGRSITPTGWKNSYKAFVRSVLSDLGYTNLI